MILYAFSLSLSSPFLFVFGDDRVICHIEANDIAGDTVDAQGQIEGQLRGIDLKYYVLKWFYVFLLS